MQTFASFIITLNTVKFVLQKKKIIAFQREHFYFLTGIFYLSIFLTEHFYLSIYYHLIIYFHLSISI